MEKVKRSIKQIYTLHPPEGDKIERENEKMKKQKKQFKHMFWKIVIFNSF